VKSRSPLAASPNLSEKAPLLQAVRTVHLWRRKRAELDIALIMMAGPSAARPCSHALSGVWPKGRRKEQEKRLLRPLQTSVCRIGRQPVVPSQKSWGNV
jgi:hypothetical protein